MPSSDSAVRRNAKDIADMVLVAARKVPPSDAVPFAFEKRVMAHIQLSKGKTDVLGHWARLLWRAAVSCVALTLLMSLLMLTGQSDSSETLAIDLERAVMAPLAQLENAW